MWYGQCVQHQIYIIKTFAEQQVTQKISKPYREHDRFNTLRLLEKNWSEHRTCDNPRKHRFGMRSAAQSSPTLGCKLKPPEAEHWKNALKNMRRRHIKRERSTYFCALAAGGGDYEKPDCHRKQPYTMH